MKERVEGWMLCTVHMLNAEEVEKIEWKWMNYSITGWQASMLALSYLKQYQFKLQEWDSVWPEVQ